MRIVGGTCRGLRLTPVAAGDAAAHLRPTSDRVRESLFSILTAGRQGDRVREARVLDLFAGTGALGIEALSRGAIAATFVDDGRIALDLLRRNLALAGMAGRATILRSDARRLPPAPPGNACDLIFLDPPYGKALGGPALAAAANGGWIAPGALIVWEESGGQAPPPGFGLVDRRRYGDTHITMLEAAS